MLERLGLVLMLYGLALHTWRHIPTLLLANVILLCGAALLIAGGAVERWARKRWPDVPW